MTSREMKYLAKFFPVVALSALACSCYPKSKGVEKEQTFLEYLTARMKAEEAKWTIVHDPNTGYDTITIKAKVHRGLRGLPMLKETGLSLFYSSVPDFAYMPLLGEAGKPLVEVVCFRPGHSLKDIGDVEVEREKMGLGRDLQAQIAVNRKSINFSIAHPGGDVWQGADGRWYFIEFSAGETVDFSYFGGSYDSDGKWCNNRPKLHGDDDIWNENAWFCGVRKAVTK